MILSSFRNKMSLSISALKSSISKLINSKRDNLLDLVPLITPESTRVKRKKWTNALLLNLLNYRRLSLLGTKKTRNNLWMSF